MRVPHEQVAGHDRDPTEPETIATSHQKHTMQDSSRPRARDVTEGTNSPTPTVSIEDFSDDRPSPPAESQSSLGEQLANLAISSPVLARSPSPPLSPDHALQSVEVAEPATVRGPITVKDLLNATPRPSPSPESHTQPALRAYGHLDRVQGETIDEPNSSATGEESDISESEVLSSQDESDSTTAGEESDISESEDLSSQDEPKSSARGEESDIAESEDRSVQNEPNSPPKGEESDIPGSEDLSNQDEPILYEVLDEPLPPGPFSDRDYQNALKSARALTRGIFMNLSHCEWSARPGTQLHKIKQMAEALNKLDNPASRTIGIVGDSAAGKSSLINSLLHLPNLAHKGDHGSAVTSFVTEYRQRTPSHRDIFTIEVEFANPEEINEQIHELLFSFRDLYRERVEEETAADVYQGIEKRSEIAFNTLQSIFPNRPETEAGYLKGADGHTFEQIESSLQFLAGGLGWPEGSVNGKWTSTAVTAKECHEKVAHFMENGLWPLTNIVRCVGSSPRAEAQSHLTDLSIAGRIYLSAQVLKTGIILADLPGYRDINLARVKKAEEYLFHCDELFVVANINRVVTNETVKEILHKKLGPHMTISENVSVICTHADEIDIPEYEKSRNWATTANSTEAKAAKRAVQEVRSRRGAAEERERLETKYKYFWISARNADIKAKVRRQYQGNAGSSSLNVFCIGNKDYDMERVQFWYHEAHEMAIRGSGIPELRKHCHSIVAKAQFRVSNHFLKVEVLDLVQSLEVWTASAEHEAPPAMPFECIPDLESDLLERVNIFSDSIDKQLKTQILDFWRRRERAFNQQAREASREWEGWHHTSYKAWVSQNGTHETRAQGFRRWNDELLWQMNQDTKDRWAELLVGLDEQSDVIQSTVKDEIEKLSRRMRKTQIPQALVTLLGLKKREIIYLLQEELSTLRRDFKTIEYNASGDHVTSLIIATMLPTYRDCAKESGTGMEARMHGIMASRMGLQDIFRSIYDSVNTEMNLAIDERVDNISNHIIEMCADIGRQIETVKGEEAQEALRSHPKELRRIQATIATARDRVSHLRFQAATARKLARSWNWTE